MSEISEPEIGKKDDKQKLKENKVDPNADIDEALGHKPFLEWKTVKHPDKTVTYEAIGESPKVEGKKDKTKQKKYIISEADNGKHKLDVEDIDIPVPVVIEKEVNLGKEIVDEPIDETLHEGSKTATRKKSE